MKATSTTGPTLSNPLMMPTSPLLCFCSSRVKATAAGDAPAFDIWLMKQSAQLGGWGKLSQALWAAARKVDGICQTEAAVMRAAPAAGGTVGAWAKEQVASSRAAANATTLMISNS